MTNFMTGTINKYYVDEEALRLGDVAMTDEMYARQNRDDTWNVHRMVCKPLLPDGVNMPHTLAMLFATITPLTIGEDEGPQIIAKNVTSAQARKMLHSHELPLQTYPGLPVVRAIVKSEDAGTYWRQNPHPENNFL